MDERASGNLTKDSKVPQHALDTTGVAAYVRLQTLQKFVNKKKDPCLTILSITAIA